MATLAFSTSLGGLVSEPERYGWPYDVGVMVGFGYGGLDVDAVETTLDRAEVLSWGVAGLPQMIINGDSVPVVGAGPGFDDFAPPVIDGEVPRRDDELALGVDTARRLGGGIGDEVTLANEFGELRATVSGLVVLPPLGPFAGQRAGSGTGALLSAALYDVSISQDEEVAGMPTGTLRTFAHAFVGIELREDVDPDTFLRRIAGGVDAWDANGFVLYEYPRPVRPAQIADVAAMQRVPVALGGCFALAMAIGLALGIATATRSRRRELAVLRALGFSGRQLAASVRWHAVTVVLVALAVGVPVGIAVGRTLYRSFADELGVVPMPMVSLPWTALVVAATVAIGLLAAAGPAHRSARAATASVLREE